MFTKKTVNESVETSRLSERAATGQSEQTTRPEALNTQRSDTSPNTSAMASPSHEKSRAPMPVSGAATRLGGKSVSASIISSDLTIVGNLKASGEVQIEGTIEGDINAHHVNVGETATIRGEIVADDIVVYGKIIGRIRGEKVRLSSTAQVEGDIIHRNIAIESGAHFEGSVQRSDTPLGSDRIEREQPEVKEKSQQIEKKI